MQLKNVTVFNDKFLFKQKTIHSVLSDFLHFFTFCYTVDFCSCVFAIFGSSLNYNVLHSCSLLYFQLGGITKNVMTGPSANSEFCFPSTLDVPLGCASGNIEGLGEIKLTVLLGASH